MVGSVSFRAQGTSGVLEAFSFPLSHCISTVAVPAVQRPEHEEGVTLYFTAVTLEGEHVQVLVHVVFQFERVASELLLAKGTDLRVDWAGVHTVRSTIARL